jgi:NAD(P)-dependent dehydrogenase (short-subunit alcohol dehydrogenase family)
VLHAGVVLVAVAAGGIGLAFAAVALARGAQALGGVGEGERDEEDKRGERRDHAAAEWGEKGPEGVRNEKGHVLRVLGEVARE